MDASVAFKFVLGEGRFVGLPRYLGNWETFMKLVLCFAKSGLLDEDEFRPLSERPLGKASCHPSYVVSSCSRLLLLLSTAWSERVDSTLSIMCSAS